MINNNGKAALEMPPFKEINERPGYYVFTQPEGDLFERTRLPDLSNLVGAVGVSLAIGHDPGTEAVLNTVHTSSLKDKAVPVVVAFTDAYSCIADDLHAESITPELEYFRLEAARRTYAGIRKSSLATYPETAIERGRLIGGVAVFDTPRGQQAGIFVLQDMVSGFKSAAHNLDLEDSDWRPPAGYASKPDLQAERKQSTEMIASLRRHNATAHAAVLSRAILNEIGQYLPSTTSLEDEINPRPGLIDVSAVHHEPVRALSAA